jgi:hypothetical protein
MGRSRERCRWESLRGETKHVLDDGACLERAASGRSEILCYNKDIIYRSERHRDYAEIGGC